MAETAGILISPLLQTFFQKMSSFEFVDFFRERTLNDGLLMRLKITLLSVIVVLEDAEDKQFTNPDVKVWLDELKDAVYDAEDVLDKIAAKNLRRKLNASKVRNPNSTSKFVKEVERKMQELLDCRLEFLVKQKDNLGLRAGVKGQSLERLPTTSLVDESSICGRHDDKGAIIKSLLSDGASGDEMSTVIAIVGMGGIGKTTLAQLVYNDDSVKKHFDLKAWVCVSDDFDVLKLTKTIVEKVTEETYDTMDLDRLQSMLQEKLMKKKFLLVLDDVWSKKFSDWELLSIPFKFGTERSRVIVTTRDEEVASVMFASATHRLNELPKEDCWSLFEKYAFHNCNSDARKEREAIGRQIVEKCKGLPLAIKAIGALLRSKVDVKEYWDKVLRSELWDSPIKETNILPALRLSYKYLSPELKRCFAYCSIFPKGYAFKKDRLVLLWMAEGFLLQPKNKTMEEVGDDYFVALVSRSLFQRSGDDEYIMHDLVSDLAKFISKQFTLSHEDDSSREIGSNTRHFSYSSSNFDSEKFKALLRAERLRTIVELNFASGNTLVGKGTQFPLPMIRCLRVLILSHYGDITKLPDSIGKLIHLRYLDLSSTKIERLPDSICKLCNLQILNLSRCRDLVALPEDMHKLISLQMLNLLYCRRLAALPKDLHKLINLRHLDIAETMITEMPINLGKLKCLQTLSTFVVSKHSGCGIEELGKLKNLRGSLSVLKLQNVKSPMDAKDVNLRDGSYLEKLVLNWEVDTSASESHKTLLHTLEPHSILKSLSINGYGGTSFPNWVGDASFSNIASLCLEECKFCCSLPQLGQLPSLQKLSIIGLEGVVTVGTEFYGTGSSSMKPFGALKYLNFSDMSKWKDWLPFEAENEGGAFLNLRELWISECPELTGGLPAHLSSLAKLEIYECPKLVASLPRASSQRKLMLSNCNMVLLNESPTGLQELKIKRCLKLELPMHLNYSSLEYLTLECCGFLKSFPLFPKLCHLIIFDCEDLESLTVQEQHEHGLHLSQIQIHKCPNFAYFPQVGLRAPKLKDFSIKDCRSLRSLPDKMHILSSLEKLYIADCPQVESFPEGGLPFNLNEISIINCDKLFVSRVEWDLQKLPRVRRFSIGDKSKDVESFPNEGLLPTGLTYLCFEGFPNLKSLDKKGLQKLTALEELEIKSCPELKDMLDDGMPASLFVNISE